MTPKALLFDVGGTVFDWKSTAIQAARERVGGAISDQELHAFAADWRREFFFSTGKSSPRTFALDEF